MSQHGTQGRDMLGVCGGGRECKTCSGGISGSGGMRRGMVFSPACSAVVSSGCMPLPVECLRKAARIAAAL